MAGGHDVQAVVLHQPACHLGRGVLQRLIQRAGVAEGEDVTLGFAARPDDAALFDGQADGDLKTGFDPGADNFAIPLDGMAIAEEEQRAGGRDREPDGGTGAEAAVIHVAAVFGTGRGRDRLTAVRRHAKAADHRRERQRQVKPGGWVDQGHGAGIAVDGPVGAVAWRQVGHEGGIDDILGQRGAGPAGGAGRLHRQNLDPQAVARHRPLNRDRAVHRVRAMGDLLPGPVPAVGVDGVGGDGIAARHGQGGGQGAEHVVIAYGNEMMCGHPRRLAALALIGKCGLPGWGGACRVGDYPCKTATGKTV